MNKSIKKDEVISYVASDIGIPKRVVYLVIDSIVDKISKEISDGNVVYLSPLGVFSSTETKEREWVNPKTGETSILKSSIKPKLKFSKGLINSNKKGRD